MIFEHQNPSERILLEFLLLHITYSLPWTPLAFRMFWIFSDFAVKLQFVLDFVNLVLFVCFSLSNFQEFSKTENFTENWVGIVLTQSLCKQNTQPHTLFTPTTPLETWHFVSRFWVRHVPVKVRAPPRSLSFSDFFSTSLDVLSSWVQVQDRRHSGTIRLPMKTTLLAKLLCAWAWAAHNYFI